MRVLGTFLLPGWDTNYVHLRLTVPSARSQEVLKLEPFALNPLQLPYVRLLHFQTFNPLSPNIHIQILQTYLYIFP